jgi:hypothetical protein
LVAARELQALGEGVRVGVEVGVGIPEPRQGERGREENRDMSPGWCQYVELLGSLRGCSCYCSCEAGVKGTVK